MQISFTSPIWCSEVDQFITKGTRVQIYHLVGLPSFVLFKTPIDLKPGDLVFIDHRNGQVEWVERDNITIWRADWKN